MGSLGGYIHGRMNFLGNTAPLLVGKISGRKITFRVKHLQKMIVKMGELQNA